MQGGRERPRRRADYPEDRRSIRWCCTDQDCPSRSRSRHSWRLLLLIFSPTLYQPGRPESRPNFNLDFGTAVPALSSLLLALYLPHVLLFIITIFERLYRLQARRRCGREPGKSDPAEQLQAAGAADTGGQVGIDRPICPSVQPERLHRGLHQAGADRPAADDGRAHADLRGACLVAARRGEPEELLRPDQADARRLHRLVRAAAGGTAARRPGRRATSRRRRRHRARVGPSAWSSARFANRAAPWAVASHALANCAALLVCPRRNKETVGGNNNENAQLSGLPVRRAAADERGRDAEAAGHARCC